MNVGTALQASPSPDSGLHSSVNTPNIDGINTYERRKGLFGFLFCLRSGEGRGTWGGEMREMK